MLSFRSILDDVRETVLYCSGSPHSRLRQLTALRNLDAHLLKDIGLTAEEVRRGGHHRAAAREELRPAAPLEFRGTYPNQ